MLRVSAEEIVQKLREVHGDQITIDITTYISMGTKARFIDATFGEWWATPTKVITRKHKHPSTRLLTLEKIIKRLFDKFGDVVTIDESSWTHGCKKAKFIDKDYGEFTTNVSKVLNSGTQHPARSEKIRVAKIQASHARPEFREHMSNAIKQKIPDIKKTVFERYGVEFTTQLPHVIEAHVACRNTPEAIEKKKVTKKARRKRSADRRRSRNDIARKARVANGELVGTDSQRKKLQEQGFFHDIDGMSLKYYWSNLYSDRISYSYFCKIADICEPKTAVDVQKMADNYIHMTNIEVTLSSNPNITYFNRYPFPKANFKPDFKINDKLYVNVDGLYWHCSKVLDPNYHYNLREVANKTNISILQFRADEVTYKRNIVDSMIAVKAGLATKLHARKLQIQEIGPEEARCFLESNHLMGFKGANKHISLRDSENIYAVLSLIIDGTSAKIVRFGGALNTVVMGGYSRLLSYSRKQWGIKEFTTFIDLRYGDTKALIGIGFKHISTTLGWKWTDYDKTFNRLKCRANMDERRLTEAEHAKELKWVRIYDAGQAKLVWTIGDNNE